MSEGSPSQRWVDRVEAIRKSRRARRLLYAVLSLVVLVDFFVPREHVFFPWEAIPGFSALYGWISCVLIIVVSKLLGHFWLMKRENYYD